jgi:hypothetical protein
MAERQASPLGGTRPAAPAAEAKAPVEVPPVTYWRVGERVRLQHKGPGGGEYVLPIGKVLASTSYDIDDLKNRGVKLTQVDAPRF